MTETGLIDWIVYVHGQYGETHIDRGLMDRLAGQMPEEDRWAVMSDLAVIAQEGRNRLRQAGHRGTAQIEYNTGRYGTFHVVTWGGKKYITDRPIFPYA